MLLVSVVKLKWNWKALIICSLNTITTILCVWMTHHSDRQLNKKLTFKLTSRSISLKFILIRNAPISAMPFNGSDRVKRRSRLWWLGFPFTLGCQLSVLSSFKPRYNWIPFTPNILYISCIEHAVLLSKDAHTNNPVVRITQTMYLVDSTYRAAAAPHKMAH